MSRIRVYHFHNGTGGGVLSVIKNLISHSSAAPIENHVIHAINPQLVPNFRLEPMEGVASQQVFRYSPKDNFYFTCTQLKKLLPDEEAVIVAHDWVELGMLSNLGLQNPVVQFLHGAYDYYYNLAIKHEAAVDLFVAVAGHIKQKLSEALPHRREDIFYLRLPVPSVQETGKRAGDAFRLIFIGRPEKAKGYQVLPEIEKSLRKKAVNVEWHIVGAAADEAGVQWPAGSCVRFYGAVANETVQKLLPTMHLLVLPSLAEGMPVSVIEAMKAGVIPVVNEIDGGIQELVFNDETGFKIENNSIEGYAEKIAQLVLDKNLILRLRGNAILLANALFDPVQNTKQFEELLVKLPRKTRRNKPSVKAYGSRLDQRWLPNGVTRILRVL